jgi:predicted unusual protein kinase regulating ubiquinone biosynthesis (AarF/ABC1/UbiB family)
MHEIARLIRNKRFRKTSLMFFGFMAQFWWLGKIKGFMSQEKRDKKYHAIYQSQAIHFTKLAVEMGGLIIKLGQFVSSRVDILPKEYTDTLSLLQDSVSPEKTEMIITRIEEECKRPIHEVFTTFENTPVAAASLGQVHKATLPDGTTVAVKVMRPGIEEIVSLDLATLRVLIAFAGRFTKVGKFVDLKDVYQEFEEVITLELDYQKEAQHLERFRENFLGFPGITVPNLFDDYSSSKMLVMEFIDGVKINEFDKLDEVGINKGKLGKILYLSYLQQLLEDGFFHADPHPGNILVKKDGTIVYIDFGMVGSVSDSMKENMFRLAMAVYLKDSNGVVESLDGLGFLRKQADKGVLGKNVKVLLENLSGSGFDIKKLNNDDFLEELREFLYQQPFQIPSRSTFLGKAIITVFSICMGLNPKFDFIGLAKPFVEDMMKGETKNVGKDTILDEVKDVLLKVIPSSKKLYSVIDQLEAGDLRVRPSIAFENKIMAQQDANNQKLILAIFGLGMIIAGTQVLDYSINGAVGLMVLGSVVILFQAMRKTHSRRRRRPPHGKMFSQSKNE